MRGHFVKLFVGMTILGTGAIIFTQKFNSRSLRASEEISKSFSPSSSVTFVVSTSSPIQTNARVVRVLDGDTLLVKLDNETGSGGSQETRVRLLGINTPEVVDPRRPVECFGKEASARMYALATGARVRLEADPQADERDAYHRLLRNVFLADGTDLNATMVREGFAYASLSFPLAPSRKRQLKKLHAEARSARRGLWNPLTCAGQK